MGNVAFGESYTFLHKKLIQNSAFSTEEIPCQTFKGRPAGRNQQRQYQIQSGVVSSQDSLYIIATNIEKEISVGDKVVFNGKEWTVDSVGFYFDESRIVNASALSEKAIIRKCPKGITIS